IAFVAAEDPVRLGLVTSLARPGGNLTGINFFSSELTAKRLELLHELLPRAIRVAVLVNPTDVTNTASTLRDVETAARAIGLQLQVLNASTSPEINAAFEDVGRDRPDALVVGGNPFLTARRIQVVQLAAFHRLPAVYGNREFVEVGGLMSYGTNVMDAYRQLGIYAGRILRGAKPADLPLVQSSKFDLVINAETARMLGLAVPPTLLARADEAIEGVDARARAGYEATPPRAISASGRRRCRTTGGLAFRLGASLSDAAGYNDSSVCSWRGNRRCCPHRRRAHGPHARPADCDSK